MDFDYLRYLKQSNPAFQLLAADNAPLILSFFHLYFIKDNQRTLTYGELTGSLEDYLHHIRESHGEDLYPKSASQYIDDWSGERSLYLRKFYSTDNDEPLFDLTPATEKVIEWIADLETREFVGTESRLLTVFQLLRDIVNRSEHNPEARISLLEQQKETIDKEIQQIQMGELNVLDPTQMRERFFQAEDTARKLLSDFRQVEHNFRNLDRRTRERITISQASKGELLDEVFNHQDEIHDSDQGRSFRGFWEFLMSPGRQDELDDLLSALDSLSELNDALPESILRRIKFFLLEAGEKIYRTNNQLAEQLRRFLDDRAWLENKRIMDIIGDIERKAVNVANKPPPQREFVSVEHAHPSVELLMSRRLFQPQVDISLEIDNILNGNADLDLSVLYEQNYIDPAEMADNIRRLLSQHKQVTLHQVLKRFPATRGLAEIIAYINLATSVESHLIDRTQMDNVKYKTEFGHLRELEMPRIIFTR